MRGRRYNRTKKSHGAEPGTKRIKSQSDTLPDTATALAEQHGVSRATVIRDGSRGNQHKVAGAEVALASTAAALGKASDKVSQAPINTAATIAKQHGVSVAVAT